MTLVDAIDKTLPQTQCTLCTYKGCRPYAEAIVNQGERIDRCEPGGVQTLKQIAAITQQDPAPYLSAVASRTPPMTEAVIRETECIGCTKCIQACPVDAIIGASKQMHTVISDACNGCGLCVPPCPVDCIDLIPHTRYDNAHAMQPQSRARYEQNQMRQRDKKTETQWADKGSIEDRQIALRELLSRKKSPLQSNT